MDIFGRIKRSTGKTTEEAFKLPPQPPETCSSIDEIIYELQGPLDPPDQLRIKESLEELRSQIVALRAWGQGWKKTAENILDYSDNFTPLNSILHAVTGTDYDV